MVKVEGDQPVDIQQVWEDTESSFVALNEIVTGKASSGAFGEDKDTALHKFIDDLGASLIEENNVGAASQMNKLTKKAIKLHRKKVSVIKDSQKMLASIVAQSMSAPAATTTNAPEQPKGIDMVKQLKSHIEVFSDAGAPNNPIESFFDKVQKLYKQMTHQKNDHATFWFTFQQLLSGPALSYHNLLLAKHPEYQEKGYFTKYQAIMEERFSDMKTEAQREQATQTLVLKNREPVPNFMDRCEAMARDLRKARFRYEDKPTDNETAIMEKVLNLSYVPDFSMITDRRLREQVEEADMAAVLCTRKQLDDSIRMDSLKYFMAGIRAPLRRSMMALAKDFTKIPVQEVLEIATNLQLQRQPPKSLMAFQCLQGQEQVPQATVSTVEPDEEEDPEPVNSAPEDDESLNMLSSVQSRVTAFTGTKLNQDKPQQTTPTSKRGARGASRGAGRGGGRGRGIPREGAQREQSQEEGLFSKEKIQQNIKKMQCRVCNGIGHLQTNCPYVVGEAVQRQETLNAFEDISAPDKSRPPSVQQDLGGLDQSDPF